MKKGDRNDTEGKGGDSSLSILFRTALSFGNAACFTQTHTHSIRMEENFKMKCKQKQMNQTHISNE